MRDDPWIVVAAAREPVSEVTVSRFRLFGRVMATAIAVIVAVALLSVLAARHLAEVEAIKDAGTIADIIADAVVQPVVADGLLTGDRAALDAMGEVVRNHVLSTSIVRVKIWDASGRILYSDEPALIGQRFELEDEELDVLEHPRTDAEVSDVQAPENRYESASGTLLEVYRPVWTPSGEPLLFETYFRYDEVTQRSGDIWQGFAAVTVGSILLMVVLLVPVLRRLLRLLGRARDQREAALRRTLEASADERRRIAGTLHDGVVQDLAGTSFALAGAAERATGAGEATAAADLRAAAGTLRGSIGSLRSLLVDIYPPSLAAAGLRAALEDLAIRVRARGVAVRFEVDPAVVVALNDAQQRLVFRVTQECLQNVVAHAGATEVRIILNRSGADAVLEIADDGSGFDAPAALARPADGHFGLRVLADVVTEAGAELALLTAPGAGTRWRLTMSNALPVA